MLMKKCHPGNDGKQTRDSRGQPTHARPQTKQNHLLPRSVLLDTYLQPGRSSHSRTRFQIPGIKVVPAADNSTVGSKPTPQRSQPILGGVPLLTPTPQHAAA